jgi:hypothetical protein
MKTPKDNRRHSMQKARGAARTTRRSVISSAALVACAALGTTATAVEIDAGPDWAVRWDNTISYNLGVRAQGINDNIGNHPMFAAQDYSYKRGDVVTSRVSDLMEFDAQNKAGWGARASASLFKDFAFHDGVRTNPGELAPGTPYSSLGAYTNNEFSSYTKRYYKQGAELLDAFVFSNFKLGDRDASVLAGRLTKYWGNSVFFGPSRLWRSGR